MNLSKDKINIYISALLHDIGKFYQRADEKNGSSFKFLNSKLWNNPGIYCPSFNGQYTHKHVLWTAQFFEDEKDIFRNVLPDSYKILESLASSHHNPHPENLYEKIIQKADHWSSGIDRTSPLGMEDGKDETEKVVKNNFKTVEMCSVFEHLFNDDIKNIYNYRLPISELKLNKDFFPKSKTQEEAGYLKLWNEFTKEFKSLKTSSPEAFCNSLLYILHKYLVHIPSSTLHLPDVSLFDHSKTVAALAVCIYDYLNEKSALTKNTVEIENNEEAVLLVGGDLSGIQNYIYNIVSNKASKNLKGRSFYLQLIVDFVIREILTELQLLKANIIYSSGGGFHLLAANTEKNKIKIKELEKNISDRLYKQHNTELFLAIDYESLSENDLYTGNLGEKWKALIEKLNYKKRSKFKDKLNLHYKDFFEPFGIDYNIDIDDITGEEVLNKSDLVKVDELVVSKHTANQIKLGETLRNTSIIAFTKTIQKGKSASYFYLPSPVSEEYCYFIEHNTNAIFDNADILILNQTQIHQIKGNNNSYGFDFIGGNDFPKNNQGQILSFNELGGNGYFKRIAVLRMDVDNLGSVFINGFSNKRKTFSRYTALSRSMDFFFKGYINTLRNENENFRNYIFIVYSGGDDLFVVGKWDTVIEFADLIQKEFSKWVCNNKHLTLSAGIAIVNTKFPILKAAEMAGEAEKKAKQHSCNGEEKNSITLFDCPLNWKYEFLIVKQLKNELVKHFSNKDKAKSFLEKISILYDMKKEADKHHLNPQWKWIMAYDFARMKQQYQKEDKEFENYIVQLQENILCNTYQKNKIIGNYHFLELLVIAARWTELLIKTN